MSEPTQWEYATYVIKNPRSTSSTRTLEHFGRGGWELVTVTSTVKFWNVAFGNDVLMVFKRPTNEPADLSLRAPARYDDQGAPIADPFAARPYGPPGDVSGDSRRRLPRRVEPGVHSQVATARPRGRAASPLGDPAPDRRAISRAEVQLRMRSCNRQPHR